MFEVAQKYSHFSSDDLKKAAGVLSTKTMAFPVSYQKSYQSSSAATM